MKSSLPKRYSSVLEIGSLDINGGVRDLLSPEADYLGVDLQEGPGVDLVADGAQYHHPGGADVVLCLEVLEHCKSWPDLIRAAWINLSRGGRFIVTCATLHRSPHSARHERGIEPDEWYANISEDDLRVELARWFISGKTDVLGNDLRAWAVK